MIEAQGIVNSTPFWAVSDNAGEPQPLFPMMLVTQKEDIGTSFPRMTSRNRIWRQTMGKGKISSKTVLGGVETELPLRDWR